MKVSRWGFTLIELLIVVAIIAILAAIAVPNFLEAQTRAKVSRAKTDMRSLSVGVETYVIDYNSYLYCNGNSSGLDQRGSTPPRVNSRPTFERLTTPVAYLTSIFPDPFRALRVWDTNWNTAGDLPTRDLEVSRYYYYTARNNSGDANARWDEAESAGGEPKPVWYLLESSGPDLTRHNMQDALNLFPVGDPRFTAALYDSTNGTVSRGSIWRTGATSDRAQDREFQQLVQGQQK